MIWIIPVRTVAAKRYCKPCSLTKVIISKAIAPVAAEIMAVRPPKKAIVTAIQKDAYKPTCGSTPAIAEKAMDSGINASPTTRPASTSVRILENHSSFFRLITQIYQWLKIWGMLSHLFVKKHKNYLNQSRF